MLEAQIERHMVDAGAVEVDLFDRNAQVDSEFVRRMLHAVAQTDGLDRGAAAIERPGDHGHRVGVIDVQRTVSALLDVAHHLLHDGDRAQRAHDAADAQRIGDRLFDAILARDVEVDDGGRAVPTDLNRIDDVTRAFKGLAAVGGCRNRRRGTDRRGDPVRNHLGQCQTLFVDIVQGNLAPGQFRERENVPEQVTCEYDAAGADQRNFERSVGTLHFLLSLIVI